MQTEPVTVNVTRDLNTRLPLMPTVIIGVNRYTLTGNSKEDYTGLVGHISDAAAADAGRRRVRPPRPFLE